MLRCKSRLRPAGTWMREEVVGSGGEGVLVSTAVDLLAHELFGRRVCDRADCRIGRGDSADVVRTAGYPKVAETDSALAVEVGFGQQNVGGFDVAV